MCGFVASISLSPSDHGDAVSFRRILSKLDHRGPDEQQIEMFSSGNSFFRLGFCRLSITDISQRSMQPFSSRCGRYKLLFNGEIYNFKEIRKILSGRGVTFRTSGDTEVVLEAYIAWGIQSLSRFDGSFSLVVIDLVRNVVLCARDRFGDKPLFYSYTNQNGLKVSSDKRSILSMLNTTPCIDIEELSSSVLGISIHGKTKTIFEGVLQLQPATFITLSLDDNELKLGSYWFPNYGVSSSENHPNKKESFLNFLSDSISQQIPEEVNFGLSLSAGFDSTLLLQQLLPHLRSNSRFKGAISIGFPGHPRIDESEYVKQIATTTGIPLFQFEPKIKDLVEDLQFVHSVHQDVLPGLSTLLEWEVSKYARQLGIKVMLDGQGADEIFAGYDYYEQYFKDIPHHLEFKRRLGVINFRKTFGGNFYSQFMYQKLHEVLTKPSWASFLEANYFMGSLQQNLQIGDRNSMAHSVELRHPYLANKLVSFAENLSSLDFWRDGKSKFLLKDSNQLLTRLNIAFNTKLGFEAPASSWLTEPSLSVWINDRIFDKNAQLRSVFGGEFPVESRGQDALGNLEFAFRWASAEEIIYQSRNWGK
jgi:asparagine synthase (glutamine-hydrolysing)